MPEIALPDAITARRRTRTYDVAEAGFETFVAALRLSLTPTGSLAPFLSNSDPGDGWKLCNGQSLAKTEFPTLYAVIGGAYGETTDTFNLPDLRGRTVLGAGGTAGASLFGTGGAHEVTLTVEQLPPHGHGITDQGHTHAFTGTPHGHGVTDPGHSHTSGEVGTTAVASGSDEPVVVSGSTTMETTGISIDDATAGGTNASAATGVTVDSTGSGDAIDILPPYVGVNWIIRT